MAQPETVQDGEPSAAPADSWTVLAPIIDRFEEAWFCGRQPSIQDFLNECPRNQATLLLELVHIDLENRLKAGEPARVEDYLERFPDLRRDAESLVALLEAAYEQRRRREPALMLSEYSRRFPSLEGPLRTRLTPTSGAALRLEAGASTTEERPDPAAAEAPQRLGRYRITRQLGAGGFGAVYEAYDDELRRTVAVKVPHRPRSATERDVDMYLREARILAALNHPGIVPVYDIGRTDDGWCYLVSQFVPGSDLATRMQQGRLPAAEAVPIIVQAAEALHHAHQRFLVHRDVKPANILLTADGRAVIADFGLALRDEDFGKGSCYAGTPAYMSPEQARGEGHRVDARTDVYSLGVVLYELLTGQRPFRGESVTQLLEEVKAREPRPPRQLDDTIPRELDRICLKALSKRAADRYSTASDLAEDLRHCLEGTPAPVGAATTQAEVVPIACVVAAPTVVPRGLRAFDETDAGSFLELLPGPRDRDGLPDVLRFWKRGIEETDPERTFSVGLMYGPSGCGKSSLVKAGLLPRLAGHVTALYLEATPEQTETRLAHGLRKRCPGLPPDLGLTQTLTLLRRGRTLPNGNKLLIVIDQFEQWLHARRGEAEPELVAALRQCDGRHVQCLLMVRDDFWMAATRCMRQLEVRLVEGQNSAAVDLFDLRHARKVLAAFGQAFECLPDGPGGWTPDQERFLEQAIAGLAQDGKVGPVRLALFAEMMKSRPWTPASLRELGGIDGIGVTFLEETFSAPGSPPEHRLHQRAARAVLQALLPERGTDIKGHMRDHPALLRASGYAQQPAEFAALLHILDTELRLITPTEPDELGGGDRPAEPLKGVAATGNGYYQLTHDYLVPALRQWLSRKQRETAQGRAELLLAERSAAWNARPEWRELPTAWEGLRILLWTRWRDWTPPERRLFQWGNLLRIFRPLLAASALALVLLAGLMGVVHWAATVRVHTLVNALANAETADVPQLVSELVPIRPWANPVLEAVARQAPADSRVRLHASLALVPADAGQTDYLLGRLLAARADELPVIRDMLRQYGADRRPQLWEVLECDRDGERRFRAACALASFDPDSPRWTAVRQDVADRLVREEPMSLGRWARMLRPAARMLTDPLQAVARDPGRPETERALAASVLRDYAAVQRR